MIFKSMASTANWGIPVILIIRISLLCITILMTTVLELTASIQIVSILSIVSQKAMIVIETPLILSLAVILIVASSKFVGLSNCHCVSKVASTNLIHFSWRKLNIFIMLFTDVRTNAFCTHVNVLKLSTIYFFINIYIFWILFA